METWFSQLASAQQSILDSQNSLLNSQYNTGLSAYAWPGHYGAITTGGTITGSVTAGLPPDAYEHLFPGLEGAKEKQRKHAATTCAHPNVMPEEEAWLRRRVKEIEWRK